MGKLKQGIKFLAIIIYYIFLSFFKKKHNRTVVIYYHAIKKHEIINFNKQIEYLNRKCNIIPLSEIFNHKNTSKKISVAVTFDDAFLSVKQNALPILKKYDIKAGVFVPAGNIGEYPKWDMEDDCYDKDEIIMTEEEIKETEKEGFEFYSHTMSHPRLATLNESEIEFELLNSKQKLESLLNHEIKAISYPYGSFNETVYKKVKEIGYSYGFTIYPENLSSKTDRILIGRTSVLPLDPMFIFKMKLSGAYQIKRLFGKA